MNRWLAQYLEVPKGALTKPTILDNESLTASSGSIVSPPIEHFEIISSPLEQQSKNLDLPNTLTDKTDDTNHEDSCVGSVGGVFKGSIENISKYRWQPVTNHQAQKLAAKYPDDRELWNRFWLYMGEQVDKGAPYEYVFASCENLERVWNDGATQSAV